MSRFSRGLTESTEAVTSVGVPDRGCRILGAGKDQITISIELDRGNGSFVTLQQDRLLQMKYKKHSFSKGVTRKEKAKSAVRKTESQTAQMLNKRNEIL